MARSARLLLVIVVSVCPLAALGQSQSPAALAAPLRSHLSTESLQLVSTIRGFPLGVRDKLSELFGAGSLDIANPGEPFERTGAQNPSMPPRRLIIGGCATDNHCLVYYERGGATVTHRAALFHWSPTETRMEFGGTAPPGLATIDDVKKAVVTGAVKAGTAPW